MTTRILVGDVREQLATLADESVHCVVTSPPFWGLRDYGIPAVEWPAVDYAPMSGLPFRLEIPAMSAVLGLEPTPEAYIGHMVLVFREIRRVLRGDGTAWVNMGDCYAEGGRGGNLEKATSTLQGGMGSQEASKIKRLRRDAGRPRANGRGDEQIDTARGVGPMTQPNRARIDGLNGKDLMAMPWRLGLALQADGWILRQDVIWAKPNPMPESMRDRCTKSHEYVLLLAKQRFYYFNQGEIAEPVSPNTHARLAQDVEAQIGSARANAGNRRVKTMKAVPSGWAKGEGRSHRELAGRYPAPGNKTHRGADAYQAGDERHRTKAGLVAYAAKVRKVADRIDASASANMRRGPGWRVKNNASMDVALALRVSLRNKRSVWTITTRGFKGAHFATFPPALPETCLRAGCPVGGTALDPFLGSGTTALVADRLGMHCIGIDANPAYAAMARARLAADSPLLAEVTS